jgi:hypothetical protein
LYKYLNGGIVDNERPFISSLSSSSSVSDSLGSGSRLGIVVDTGGGGPGGGVDILANLEAGRGGVLFVLVCCKIVQQLQFASVGVWKMKKMLTSFVA